VAPFLLLVTKVNIASPLLVELNNLTLLLPGAGYDQVDVHACTDRGIKVSNVPTAVDDATADVNMFLILGALRGFNTSMIALREGKWRGNPPPPLGHDPEGKTLGILGMGGIGRNLKKKAEAFGMKVVYHNRNKLSEELAGGADYVNFETLLSDSDVISLNLPLNVSFLVTALWMGMQPSTRLRWFAEYRMTCIMLS
jgi:lactate dehydrogenase-like 2-hydroxyacid dehydrogenase